MAQLQALMTLNAVVHSSFEGKEIMRYKVYIAGSMG
jgi:hypothetical protein